MLHTSHVLFSQNTFLCCPLETSNDGILNFVQILNSLSDINNYIWTSSIRSEAPDFTSFSYILNNAKKIDCHKLKFQKKEANKTYPIVFLSKITSTNLEIVTSINSTTINIFSQTIRHWYSLHEQTIMLVW